MRISNDFYPSPEGLTDLLLAKISPKNLIFEPCAGEGAISNKLKEIGHEVITNDLESYSHNSDFSFDARDSTNWKKIDVSYGPISWVITNPPYKEAAPILLNSLAFAQVGVAMLLRLTFLEPCGNRSELLSANADQLRFIMPISPRPRFRADKTGSDSVTVAWFVWYKRWSWREQGIQSPFEFVARGCQDA